MFPKHFDVSVNGQHLYYVDASHTDVEVIRSKFALAATYSDENVIRAAIREAIWQKDTSHASQSGSIAGTYEFTVVPVPTDRQERIDACSFEWLGISFYSTNPP